MTSDNGMPFPRGKANLYDVGTHMPLAIRWPAQGQGGPDGRTPSSAMTDFAPTFLEAAGLQGPGRHDRPQPARRCCTGERCRRPRHGLRRARAARQRPQGRPELPGPRASARATTSTSATSGPTAGRPATRSCGSPSARSATSTAGPPRTLSSQPKDDPRVGKFFQLACAKRPAEELYDCEADPYQMTQRGRPAGTRRRRRRSCGPNCDDWMSRHRRPAPNRRRRRPLRPVPRSRRTRRTRRDAPRDARQHPVTRAFSPCERRMR